MKIEHKLLIKLGIEILLRLRMKDEKESSYKVSREDELIDACHRAVST